MRNIKFGRFMLAVTFAAAALLSSGAQALNVGDKAPAFSLPSSTGKPLRSDDFAGKTLMLFFYIGAFTNTWTQEALAFQLDLPKFEAANAQVLGISVDFNAANQAWAEKLGLKYPLLADTGRTMSRNYGALNDDPSLANDAKRIGSYLRSKRAWFIVDKDGIVRYARVNDPRGLVPTEELLEAIAKIK